MPFYIVEPDAEYGPTVPWGPKDSNGSQAFSTRKRAERAAVIFATDNPGAVFYIVQAVASATCPLSDPVVEDVK